MATATTTPRSRARKAAAPKPAPVAEAEVAEVTPEDGGLVKLPPFDLIKGEPTKNFQVFLMPEGTGCVGKFYAPLGTERVRVQLAGPAE